jgi:hypothetical protein
MKAVQPTITPLSAGELARRIAVGELTAIDLLQEVARR